LFDQSKERQVITDNISNKLQCINKNLLYSDFLNISSRKEKLDLLKINYPEEYQQLCSDMFFLRYFYDIFPVTSGTGPKSGNASSTPKTVGQIAQQLLESWEPLE